MLFHFCHICIEHIWNLSFKCPMLQKCRWFCGIVVYCLLMMKREIKILHCRNNNDAAISAYLRWGGVENQKGTCYIAGETLNILYELYKYIRGNISWTCFLNMASSAYTDRIIMASSLNFALVIQGWHRSLKTWKVLEFENLDSRPGKFWNFCRGPWKSWNLDIQNYQFIIDLYFLL